jgi:hypothetical protein
MISESIILHLSSFIKPKGTQAIKPLHLATMEDTQPISATCTEAASLYPRIAVSGEPGFYGLKMQPVRRPILFETRKSTLAKAACRDCLEGDFDVSRK